MAQCKSTEAQESGHFECNGFAALLKGKHLTIKVTGDKVNAAYDCSLFTHDEVHPAHQQKCQQSVYGEVMKREPAAYIITSNRGRRYLAFAGSVEHQNAAMFGYKMEALYA